MHTEGQSGDDRLWQLSGWSSTNTILSRDTKQVRVSLEHFTNTYWQLTGSHCTTDHPHGSTSSSNSSDVTLLDDVLDDWRASVSVWTLPRQIDVVLAALRHRQIPRRRRRVCIWNRKEQLDSRVSNKRKLRLRWSGGNSRTKDHTSSPAREQTYRLWRHSAAARACSNRAINNLPL